MLFVASTAKRVSRPSSAVCLCPTWVFWRPRFNSRGMSLRPPLFSSYDVFKRKLNEQYSKPSKLQVGLRGECERSCLAQPRWQN